MRVLAWLVMLPIAVAVIVFSVSNRESTTVDFWPLNFTLTLPLFSIVMSSVLLGFCLGGLTAWLSGYSNRRRSRRLGRDLAAAERELATLRQREPGPDRLYPADDSEDPRIRALPPTPPERG